MYQVTRADLSVFCHLCPNLHTLHFGHKDGEYGPVYREPGALAVLQFLPGLRELLAKDGDSEFDNLPALLDVSLLTQLTSLDICLSMFDEERLGLMMESVAAIQGLRDLYVECYDNNWAQQHVHQQHVPVSFVSMAKLEPLVHLTRLELEMLNVTTQDNLVMQVAISCRQLVNLKLENTEMIVAADIILLLAMPHLATLKLTIVRIPHNLGGVPRNTKLCVVVKDLDMASARRLLPLVGRLVMNALDVQEQQELVELATAFGTALHFA